MKTKQITRKTRRGGAAVELIVAFPLLILLFIGIVDYGRVFYTWVTVSNAARAGAEYGQQNPATWTDVAQMQVVAQADGNEAGTLTINSSFFCECATVLDPGCSVCGSGEVPEVYTKVRASKTVNMFFGYAGLPSTVTVSRTAIFRSQ
ncbi:MAG: TadE/TadG family type IV pilus assembly protein [Gemmatimonadaceae bacterium]